VAEPVVVVDGDSLEDVVGVVAAAAGATRVAPLVHDFGVHVSR
jgi:hypothetical protein